MQIEEIFSILGIEPTKDEKAIKNAYRVQLVHTNPEDDPEGFKKLRTAYEEACTYARSQDEEQEIPEEDTTPSGIWVSKAAKLYGNLSTRCNEELWRKLFDEDIFISLDSNEECRRKMLIFMMNHFNYPDCVWRLIEQNLQLRNDSTRLKEQFPADFVDFLVRRCLIKEVIDYTMFNGPDDADYDAYIRCYNAAWDCLNQKDFDKLQNILVQADATGITHPYMELVRAALYRDTGDTSKAQSMIEKLHEEYPEDTTVLFQMAEFYHETKQTDLAIPCYQELKAKDNNHYMANYRLAYEYAEKKEYEAAKECIRLVMRRGHDDEIQKLRIQVNHRLEQGYRTRWEQEKDINAAKELAWCLLQDDRMLAAAKLTEEIASKVPDKIQAEFMGLCARIYMGQGKFDKTLEAADKWLKLLEKTTPPQQETELAEYNRDVEIAHRIKMSTYHMMGRGFKKYYEKALEEYEFYKQQENIDPNALIDAARIYLETEEYQKCLDIAGILLNRYQIQYAYALMQEAYVKLWDAGNVIRSGMQVIQFYPEYERPYEEIARVYYDLKQDDKLKEILELAKKNQVCSAYLDAYAYPREEKKEEYPISQYLEDFKNTYSKTLIDTGKLKYYKDGYPVITKYLNLYPCNYILNTRGLFSMAAKEYDAALKDFHKILERDPADQFALNNIGCVLKYTGRFEEALPYFEKAWYYMYREGKEEPNAMPLGNMAHTYELLGEYGLAAKTYQRLVDDNSKQKESLISMKDLSANYARNGQTYQALRVLESNMKARKEYLKLVYRVYLYAADWENADKMYETIKKHVNMYHAGSTALAERQLECEHMLAWQLMRKGHNEEALETITRANDMCDKNQIAISKKSRTDLLANKLFILAILRFSGQEPVYEVKEEKISFLNKLTGLFKKSKQEKLPKTEIKELYAYEEEGKACAEQLRNFLKGMCKEQLLEGSEWDAVNTAAFFYKERYVRYLEFMIALFAGSSRDVEDALTVLENSSRCRLCNHGQCMRYTIARALFAAYQGERRQAGEICAVLLQRQPYNLYALCGVRMGQSNPRQ